MFALIRGSIESVDIVELSHVLQTAESTGTNSSKLLINFYSQLRCSFNAFSILLEFYFSSQWNLLIIWERVLCFNKLDIDEKSVPKSTSPLYNILTSFSDHRQWENSSHRLSWVDRSWIILYFGSFLIFFFLLKRSFMDSLLFVIIKIKNTLRINDSKDFNHSCYLINLKLFFVQGLFFMNR